jgi:hypothetical protein
MLNKLEVEASLYLGCLVVACLLLTKLVLEAAVNLHIVYAAIADILLAQIELFQ